MWLNATTDYAIRMLIRCPRLPGLFPPPDWPELLAIHRVICFRSEPDCRTQDSSMRGMAQPAAISCHGRHLKLV